MQTTTTHFLMNIWLTNGRCARYAQSDPAAVQNLFAHVHPDRFFEQPNLVISQGEKLVAYPCSAIEQVDFITDELPDWNFHHNAEQVWNITAEEYEQGCFAERTAQDWTWLRSRRQTRHWLYNAIELTSGRRVYQKVLVNLDSGVRQTATDVSLFIRRLFSGPSLYSQWREGGATLVNPAKVMRFEWQPHLLIVPTNALSASPVAVPSESLSSPCWLG